MTGYAQIPTSCGGLPSGTVGFKVAVQNECGTWLLGFPVTVQSVSNEGNGEHVDGRIKNYATETFSFCTPTTARFALAFPHNSGFSGTPSHYAIRPAYSMQWYENLNYNIPICCTYDTMPAYSPLAGINFSSASPSVSTYPYNGSFATMPAFTFTVTNPFIPKYTVQGKSLNMETTQFITRCTSNSTNLIPFVNSTATYGATAQYKLNIYNSDVNRNIYTLVYNGNWGPTIGNYIDPAFNSLVAGNYYIIEVSARSSCSTGNGAYTRGHIRYLTNANTETASYTINGITPPSNCASALNVFNCKAITFQVGNAGAIPMQYKIDLKSTNASCSPITTGLNYVGTWTNGVPPTALDLRTLSDANGNSLYTISGKVQVKYSVRNGCNTQNVYTRTINVTSGPTGATAAFRTNAITKVGQTITINGCTVPANTALVYADGSTSCGGIGGYQFAMEHVNTATANEVGRTGTVFDLSTVNPGTGSSNYTVTALTERWTGSNWQIMNHNTTPEVFTGISTIPLGSLLDDNITNPYYQAFTNATLTPDGSIYRITITVTNECATVSNTQVFKLNTTLLKRLKPTILASTVFPNPFSDLLHIEMPEFEEEGSIQLLDIAGRVCYSNTQLLSAQSLDIPTQDLAKGMYLYSITIDGERIIGKLVKD